MPRYVVLGNWTEQGVRNVKETPQRTDSGGEIAEKHGLKLEQAYWTARFVGLPGKPLLLPVILCYLFEERVVDLVAANFPQRLALGEDHTVVLAAGNTVIRVAGLTRTVDHAAHDSDREVILEVLEPLFDLRRHPDNIESERARATRTGYDIRTPVPEVESREDVVGHRYLLNRVLGERDADSVPDPVG